MTVRAKTLVKDKFWIVEQDGQKLGTLQKQADNGWIFLSKQDKNRGKCSTHRRACSQSLALACLTNQMSRNPKKKYRQTTLTCMVFHAANILTIPCLMCRSNCRFTQRLQKVKASFAAGYYIICFEKGWRKAYCPKMITLSRYEYKGPIKSKLEMQQVLNNAVKEFQDTNKTN